MKTLWIARDSDGSLNLFYNKPHRFKYIFGGSPCNVSLKVEEFPSVTWENSPQQVELKLKINADTAGK